MARRAAPRQSGRFDYLDGIRGLAILAVVIVHWGLGRTTVGRGGFISVDIFFVLSGFVITTLLWRSTTLTGLSPGAAWTSFVRARIRRLYPALLGLVVVGSVLMVAIPGTPVPTDEILRNGVLTLAQVTWYPEMLGHVADPFRQTWSLGVEWTFYLTWPLVVLGARRRGASARTLGWWSLAAGLLLVAVSTATLHAEAFYFAPPGRFGQILVGAALALAFVTSPPELRPRPVHTVVTSLGLVAVVGFALAGAHPFSDVGRLFGSPMALVFAVLLIDHGYAAQGGPVHALVSSRPVTLLGRVSYSLYLWHWIPVYLLDKDKIALPVPVLAVLGLTMVVVLTTAELRAARAAVRVHPAGHAGAPDGRARRARRRSRPVTRSGIPGLVVGRTQRARGPRGRPGPRLRGYGPGPVPTVVYVRLRRAGGRAQRDRRDQHAAHVVGVEHHVLPGEAQHQPAVHDEPVVASRVADQRLTGAVPLERVGLDDDAEVDIDQVRSAQELLGVEGHLGSDVQARHGVGDRAGRRLERVGRPRVRPSRHLPGAPRAGAAETCGEADESSVGEAGPQRGVEHRERLVVGQVACAVDEGPLATGRPVDHVVGAEVEAPQVDAGAAPGQLAVARHRHLREARARP